MDMTIEDEVRLKQGFRKPGDIYQVVAPMGREELADMRKRHGLVPATFHYQDPTPEMQTDPLWNAIWDEVKTWDINVPTEYAGYMGASGNHVTAIYLAIEAQLERRFESLVASMGGRVVAAE
jgi:hypothetical protein